VLVWLRWQGNSRLGAGNCASLERLNNLVYGSQQFKYVQALSHVGLFHILLKIAWKERAAGKGACSVTCTNDNAYLTFPMQLVSPWLYQGSLRGFALLVREATNHFAIPSFPLLQITPLLSLRIRSFRLSRIVIFTLRFLWLRQSLFTCATAPVRRIDGSLSC